MSGSRQDARNRRHSRVRKRVHGTDERPRLAIYRSNKYIYAQVIDDVQGRTLAAEVGDDGRAVPVAPPAAPSLRLAMDDATWLMLGAGRPDPAQTDVEITGDAKAAAQVLRHLAVTP